MAHPRRVGESDFSANFATDRFLSFCSALEASRPPKRYGRCFASTATEWRSREDESERPGEHLSSDGRGGWLLCLFVPNARPLALPVDTAAVFLTCTSWMLCICGVISPSLSRHHSRAPPLAVLHSRAVCHWSGPVHRLTKATVEKKLNVNVLLQRHRYKRKERKRHRPARKERVPDHAVPYVV